MSMRLSMLLLAVALLIVVMPARAKDPVCFVSILPLADFVEEVSEGRIEAEVLVGPGQSPATFEASPQQMARLVKADLFFVTGMPFEQRLVEKLSRMETDVRIIDLREGIDLMRADEHGHEGHDHGDTDPHVWLDPDNVKIMAATIVRTLSGLAPERAARLEAGRASFSDRLDSVKTEIASSLAGLSNRTIYVFHPAYGYFCRAFELEQVAVEVDGKEPSARQLAGLIERAQSDQVKVVFVQPQFSDKSARTIAEAVGAAVVPIDPLARDYLDNLHRMAEAIKRGLRGER